MSSLSPIIAEVKHLHFFLNKNVIYLKKKKLLLSPNF